MGNGLGLIRLIDRNSKGSQQTHSRSVLWRPLIRVPGFEDRLRVNIG
jgi:hypothetical protein